MDYLFGVLASTYADTTIFSLLSTIYPNDC